MYLGINFVAVVIVAVIHMLLGLLWYSPKVFGKDWIKLVGISEKERKKAQSQGMGAKMLVAFIASIVMFYVVAIVIKFSDLAGSGGPGVIIGFTLWLGFIATTMLGTVLWEKKEAKLYWINSVYYLTSLVINGAILGAWV